MRSASSRTGRLVEGEKRFVDGPIVGPEHVDPVLGRSITKRERPGWMLDARRRREELAQVSILYPTREGSERPELAGLHWPTTRKRRREAKTFSRVFLN